MTDQQTSVVVGPSDSLPDILNRLRQSAGAAVALEIPDASSLFLTASEFRALQAAADRNRVAVSVTTDDPLRQQLAALFQLPVAPPSTEPVPATTYDAPQPEQPFIPDPSPPAEPEDLDAAHAESRDVRLTTLERDGVGTRVSGRADVPRQVTDVDAPQLSEEPVTEVEPAPPSRLSRVNARLRATSRRQRLIAVSALIAVLALAYLAAFLFLTRATIVLTLHRQAISQDLTLAVVAPGASQPATDLTIAATPVTFDVSSVQTMNVTGSKTVGDAPARGKVNLSNPTGKPVTIEAGTQLADKLTGTTYAIATTVEIPAGRDGAPAFSEAEVTCLLPGTVGNRDTGLLSGQLANGVYFANREAPIAGGTDRQVTVVTQADLDSLQALALADMRAQAAGRSPGPDLTVLAPTIQLTQPSFTPDHQVDQEATTVTLQATAQAVALAYDTTELTGRVADALATTTPAGYEIERSSLHLTEPVAAGGGGQTVLVSLHADGSAVAILTPENRDQIASTIAGDDEAGAAAYLATVPGVDGFTIRYSPGWLPHRIPSSSDRVRVETR